jgi:L-amino acid N-acyltransferase YncA
MEDGAPAGVVKFDFYTDSEAQVFMLVSPAARGRGVGRQLLQRALSTTTASICKADIMRENEESARCAVAAGFSEYLKPQPDGWRFFAWTRDGRSYEPSWA